MYQLEKRIDGGLWTVTALTEGIFRIQLRRDKRQHESMLTRYGIIKTDLGDLEVCEDGNQLVVGNSVLRMTDDRFFFSVKEYELIVDAKDTMSDQYEYDGFSLRVPLVKGERLFGLGDESREVISKRGRFRYMMKKVCASSCH